MARAAADIWWRDLYMHICLGIIHATENRPDMRANRLGSRTWRTNKWRVCRLALCGRLEEEGGYMVAHFRSGIWRHRQWVKVISFGNSNNPRKKQSNILYYSEDIKDILNFQRIAMEKSIFTIILRYFPKSLCQQCVRISRLSMCDATGCSTWKKKQKQTIDFSTLYHHTLLAVLIYPTRLKWRHSENIHTLRQIAQAVRAKIKRKR